MATIRKQLYDQLTTYLPDRKYSLRPNNQALEQIAKPTILIKQLALRPAPAAPNGCLEAEVVVTLASPISSPQRAEDALDDDVLEILTALDEAGMSIWTEARKVVAEDKYLAYDINMTLTTINERQTDG